MNNIVYLMGNQRKQTLFFCEKNQLSSGEDEGGSVDGDRYCDRDDDKVMLGDDGGVGDGDNGDDELMLVDNGGAVGAKLEDRADVGLANGMSRGVLVGYGEGKGLGMADVSNVGFCIGPVDEWCIK